ncbi:hypothetical protein [Falsibacillus albus]|nr:hypothetical protein [Falsibacillus albus]
MADLSLENCLLEDIPLEYHGFAFIVFKEQLMTYLIPNKQH